MPSPVRFSEVRRILERCGYTLDRVSGSHHMFVKPGVDTFSVPVHQGKVKYHYVREARRRCGET